MKRLASLDLMQIYSLNMFAIQVIIRRLTLVHFICNSNSIRMIVAIFVCVHGISMQSNPRLRKGWFVKLNYERLIGHNDFMKEEGAMYDK